MKIRTLVAVALMALLGAPFALPAEWNRKVEFTFPIPVSIPVVHQPGWGVLPPGTYVSKILHLQSNRPIVQISNKNGTEVYATTLANSNNQLKPTGDVVVTFHETPSREASAVRTIFYPGRQWRQEFVYLKVKAAEIAKTASEPVLRMPIKTEETVTPQGPQILAKLEKDTVTVVRPSGEEVITARVVMPLADVQVAKAELPKELPRCASPSFLIVLLGLLAIGAGMVLRMVKTRL